MFSNIYIEVRVMFITFGEGTICLLKEPTYIQGVPQYWAHFVFFCHFLEFWGTYRGTFDLYSTALEICYMIATRILKINLEITELK